MGCLPPNYHGYQTVNIGSASCCNSAPGCWHTFISQKDNMCISSSGRYIYGGWRAKIFGLEGSTQSLWMPPRCFILNSDLQLGQREEEDFATRKQESHYHKDGQLTLDCIAPSVQ